MMRFIFFVAWTSLSGQSLMILPNPPADSTVGSGQIMVVSRATQPAAVLQWRISVADGAILSVTIGSAAEDAGKSLRCTPPKDASLPNGNTYRCLVFGGRQTISNGSVAVVRFAPAENKNEATLRLDGALGATADGEAIRFADATSTITVKRVVDSKRLPHRGARAR